MSEASPAGALLESAGAKPWLRFEDRTVSYAELGKRAQALAGLAAARGLKLGDRVVAATRDEAEAALNYTGLILNGLTAVQLDPDTGPERAKALIGKTRPSLVIADREIAGRWGLRGQDQLIEIAPRAGRKGGLLGGLLGGQAAPAEGLEAQLAAVTPEDLPKTIPAETLAYVLFTSGTTAQPKGAAISHGALFAHLETLKRLYGLTADSEILNTLALSHADGMNQGPVLALTAGATVHRPTRVEIGALERLLDAVYQLRITHMIAPPALLSLILRLGSLHRDAFQGGDFRLLVSCAAALDAKLWKDFEQAFGVEIGNLYGLTETVTGGVFKRGAGADGKYGAIGRPQDCEVRIVGPDGAEVPGGEPGELLMRGELLMSGYFDDEAATAEAFTADGWLRTGDIARRDADGDYWICGRLKSVIIRGGFNVHPEEVAEALNTHPGVREAVAFGEPDADWGETVTAMVAAGPDVSEQDLAAHCATRLEPRKIPSRIVLVDELPRGRTGKVVIAEARELAARTAEAPAQAVEAGGDREARVLATAARCFKVPVARLSLASTPQDTPGWDSLAHLELVSALEADFGVALTPRQIMGMDDLGKALDAVGGR